MSEYYKRCLPHYDISGSIYFITFCLANSIPKHIIIRMKYQYSDGLKYIDQIKNNKLKMDILSEFRFEYFLKYEKVLETEKYCEYFLKNKKIAQIVADSIIFYDDNKYKLIAYTIMSNHVHLIIKPIWKAASKTEKNDSFLLDDAPYTISKIMQNIKKYSAKEANSILRNQGQFWQRENYDHIIRDENELYRTVEYVLNNPLKARLVDNIEDWKWNYFNPDNLVFE